LICIRESNASARHDYPTLSDQVEHADETVRKNLLRDFLPSPEFATLSTSQFKTRRRIQWTQ
jgi:hypothetical protein